MGSQLEALALLAAVGQRIVAAHDNFVQGVAPAFTGIQAAHQPTSPPELRLDYRLGLQHVASGDRVWGNYQVVAAECDLVVTASTGDTASIELWRAPLAGPKNWALLDDLIQSHLVLCLKKAFKTS